MKNFEFNRFNKVVVRDFHNTYSLFGMSMLILMLLPLLLWLFSLAIQEHALPPLMRRNFIYFAVMLTAAISSMKIYNSCNLVGKGNYFAMLPASLCEKFTSMVLYCFVVCPLVVFGGSVAVDTILTAIPYGPYKDYLWQLPEWVQHIPFGQSEFLTSFSGFLMIAVNVFSIASLFMLANTIFKKSKFVKTILWLALIGFVMMLVCIPIINHHSWLDFHNILIKIANWFHLDNPESISHFVYWVRICFDILLTFIFSFIAYRRLKKMQY